MTLEIFVFSFFFFFSSRRRHTRYWRDWSSDVCSSDLKADGIIAISIRDDDELVAVRRTSGDDDIIVVSHSGQATRFHESRSEERRVGKECRSRWSLYH